MKARTKEALSLNLYSEKYIIVLQMLETQCYECQVGLQLLSAMVW